jgi:hypothetical protein
MNVFVCRGQIFEAVGEIKFSPVYRHILVLLAHSAAARCGAASAPALVQRRIKERGG